jgi:hypothetical protein
MSQEKDDDLQKRDHITIHWANIFHDGVDPASGGTSCEKGKAGKRKTLGHNPGDLKSFEKGIDQSKDELHQMDIQNSSSNKRQSKENAYAKRFSERWEEYMVMFSRNLMLRSW